MTTKAPFLDVKSFISEEIDQNENEKSPAVDTPFLSVYESEGLDGLDPITEEYVVFLNEIYDEEFDDALFGLVNEAVSMYETKIDYEFGGAQAGSYNAERLLEEHFSPLIKETENFIETVANEFNKRSNEILSESEIDLIIDRYEPSLDMNPNFDEFFGKIKKGIKKVAKKGVKLAKKGVAAAAKMGLGPVLNKLKPLIKPLLKRVIQTAIGKLPPHLQPVARRLSKRIPFLKEVEEMNEFLQETGPECEVAHIQYEFNRHVANVIFANTELEQDLEIAHSQEVGNVPDIFPLQDLDKARETFIQNLINLKEGEDPTPHIENFVPAILPALRLGIRLAGRKRVVNFLANLLGRMLQRFVGPQHTPVLSRAIVDAGLRLIQLEATTEDETRAATTALTATVEDTVRRVAEAPEYILDDQELLEGFVLEAFEEAASGNLPAVLPEETYEKHPELRKAKNLRGFWAMMPPGKRKKYKKFSRIARTRLSPHKLESLETYDGIPMEDFLVEEMGLDPGEEAEAFVHLYEAIAGTKLSDIVRSEENVSGSEAPEDYSLLHPLTREAAELLLNEPDLAEKVELNQVWDPHSPEVGDRFYYLEIPGKKSLSVLSAAGKSIKRRTTQFRLILDFPGNEIRIYLFLSEIRAQEIAVKLRQHAHVGNAITRLRHYVERGLRSAMRGSHGRLKVVHEAIVPEQMLGAIRGLPSIVPQILQSRLKEWILKGLSEYFKQNSEIWIKAAEDTADGVTVKFTIANPPGFQQLRQIFKGNILSLASLRKAEGFPKVNIKVFPGYKYE